MSDVAHDAAALKAPDEPSRLIGRGATIAMLIAVCFSAFQVVTAAYNPLPSIVLRSLHLGFLLFLAFALYRFRSQGLHAAATRAPFYDWILGGLAFGLSFYLWIFQDELILRDGDPTKLDLAVGIVMLILVFEAARRIMGWALPLICFAFLLYGLFGEWLPGALATRGYGLDQVIGQLYLGSEGIYGVPTLVSATYIFLFILFGAFLEQAGMLKLFNDVAMGSVGWAAGGPAKGAVIASGLMGMINGSGVANVVSTGQFTIPLMKRSGYRAEFAGAVEATASMGGQIMPPVMGAVAFIMAETLDVPYAEIALAASIPATLYFASAFWMVHLEARLSGLQGLPAEQCPAVWPSVKAHWRLLPPLGLLIWLLFAGYTPLFAGLASLGLTAVLILSGAVSDALSGLLGRALFWVLLGVTLGAFLKFGVDSLFVVVALMTGGVYLLRGGKDTLRAMWAALAEAPRSALPVGIACALVGVIIGVMTLTGLGSSIARTVIVLAGDNKFLALVLTMIVSLILGMGVPTIPNYIITSSLAAPALKSMGVEPIVSHFFVFYFGIMADLTPPVALAAFAAASIAKASPMKIGFLAVRVALAGFVIPYIFVYDPALLLQHASPWAVLYVTVKAGAAILLWGCASAGWMMGRLNWPERAAGTAAAALLVFAIPWTDEAGFALGAALALWRWRRARSV